MVPSHFYHSFLCRAVKRGFGYFYSEKLFLAYKKSDCPE